MANLEAMGERFLEMPLMPKAFTDSSTLGVKT
jgi:hypothetical protein